MESLISVCNLLIVLTRQGIWSNRTVSLLGETAGIYSTIVGIFAVVTILLVLRGRARGFVLGVWYVFLAIGVAFLIAGIAAIAGGQRCAVSCPIVLTGVIHTALAAAAIRVIRKWFERVELRKMSAQDVAGTDMHC